MKLSYALTLNDYKAALHLHATHKLISRINHYFWFAAVPILAVLGMIWFIFGDTWETTDIGSPYRIAEGVLIWFSIFLPGMRFINARRCFKLIFPPASKDKNVLLDVDDERIISAIPGVSEGKFFWNAIVDFAQDEKVTLLYIRKRAFLFVPTSALSPPQRTELNELVARHLTKGNS